MNEIPKEEFIQKLEEAFEWMKKQPIEIIGTKENPYYCYCNNEIYKKFKELPLDENDMYCWYGGWVKVINVDKPFEVEVKPYEPKFNNTNHKPFYREVFKKNENDYVVKVLGKWRKKMTKELEALKRIRQETCPATYMDDFDKNECCDVIEQALLRLESIDNSNPSEALECLEKLKGMEISSMPFSDEYGTQEVDLNDIRKVGSQLNTDFREYTATIKQALLKAEQEPKQYLKWEDLEFNIEKQMMTVLLNGTKYTLIVGRNVHIDKLAFLINGEINYYFLEDDKQFFNDLHLERVEE